MKRMKRDEAISAFNKFESRNIYSVVGLMKPVSEKGKILAGAINYDVLMNHRVFSDDDVRYYFDMLWPDAVCGYKNGCKEFQEKLFVNFKKLLEVLFVLGNDIELMRSKKLMQKLGVYEEKSGDAL